MVARTAGLIFSRRPVRFPNSALSMAPLIAPQAVWPITRTTFAPASLQARHPTRVALRCFDEAQGPISSSDERAEIRLRNHSQSEENDERTCASDWWCRGNPGCRRFL